MFQLITRQYQANRAAKRWKVNYPKDTITTVGSSNKTYDKLIDLGPTPNPDDVDKIIGNNSWTEVPRCEQCDKRVEAVVEVGQEPDWESRTCYLCKECITKLYNFIQGSNDVIQSMDRRQETNNSKPQSIN